MGTIAVERPVSGGVTEARRRRVAGSVALVLVLLAAVVVSLAVGARALTPAEVWRGLSAAPDPDQRLTEIRLIVRTVRVPRTVLAVVAGLALGVGGALIQGYTRNPIADTGLLGVNSGASFAVVLAIALFGFASPFQYVWFAFLGAAVGMRRRGLRTGEHRPGAGNPLTLALALPGGHGVPRRDDHGGRAVRQGLAERPAVLEQPAPWPVSGSTSSGR